MLKKVAKGWSSPERYEADLKAIRAKGIQVIALMMMGLDGQTRSSFEATRSFLERSKVSLVKLFTPAPYPGTKFHDDMKKAGRIVDDDWSHYDYGSILLSPTGMTPDELRGGFDTTYRDFYSLSSIARRMLPVPGDNKAEHAAYVMANLKTHLYLRKNPSAWGTLS